jgi:hypothetical protein
MNRRNLVKLQWILILALSLSALPLIASAQAGDDAVVVSDQSSDGLTVVVDSVTAAAPGWIVIHLDNNGAPGPVIGQSAVDAGENLDVEVELDPALDSDTALWAMLHVDEGVAGEYEFPGPDVPVRADNMIVMSAFTASVEAADDDEPGNGTVPPGGTVPGGTVPGGTIPPTLPETGAGLGSLAQTLPALLATISALAASVWIGRQRK